MKIKEGQVAVKVEEKEAGESTELLDKHLEVLPPSEEKATDYERGVYGEKNIQRVLVSDLVLLTQVRNVRNREATKLKESIARRLINQIDVARMSLATFTEYVEFTNRIWGVENDPGASPISEDGFIYLVMAGHTRVEAIKELEAKRPRELPTEDLRGPVIDCKIHDAISPQEILDLQLDENIHSQPPQERKAMAIIETYFYGVEQGKWSNKAEFHRETKNRFSHSTLDDALNFAVLPADIRDFVIGGGISYRAGVELGKILPTFCHKVLAQYFDGRRPSQLSADELESLSDGAIAWLGAEVAHIQNEGKRKMNTTTLKSRYESYQAEFEGIISRQKGEKAEGQQFTLNFTNSVAADEWKGVVEGLQRKHARLARELAEKPLETAADLVNLHFALSGRGKAEDSLPDILEEVRRSYIQRLGKNFITTSGGVDGGLVYLDEQPR